MSAIPLGTPQEPTQGTTVSIPIPEKLPVDPVVLTEVPTIAAGITGGGGTYVHPNHIGQVQSIGDGATTVLVAAITDQTELTSGLVSTDELLVNDGGVLKRMDISVIEAYMQANLTFTTPYTHPNHTGEVTSSGDGAQTVHVSAISNRGTVASTNGSEQFLVERSGSLYRMPIAQLVTYYDANLSFAGLVHTHTVSAITDLMLPVAGSTIGSTSVAETLILSDSRITNAVYEGNLGNRVIRVDINYVWTQSGGTTPSGVMRVKLGTTTLVSTVSVSTSQCVGSCTFWITPMSTTQSHVHYVNIYNTTQSDLSAQSLTQVTHGTEDTLNVYFDGAGNIDWDIKSVSIEVLN